MIRNGFTESMGARIVGVVCMIPGIMIFFTLIPENIQKSVGVIVFVCLLILLIILVLGFFLFGAYTFIMGKLPGEE